MLGERLPGALHRGGLGRVLVTAVGILVAQLRIEVIGLVTLWPFCGDSQVVPWMSWIRSGPGVPPPPPPPDPPALAAPGVGVPVTKSVPFWSVSAVAVR
jgi:hypothetical protein